MNRAQVAAPGLWAWRGGVLVAVLVLAVVLWTQRSATPLPGREQADLATEWIAAFLGLAALLSAVACIGSLLRVAALSPPGRVRSGSRQLGPDGLEALRVARRWAQLWATAAALLVPFNAAHTEGYPIGYALTALGDFVSSSQTAQAWLLTAVLALLVSGLCWFTTWRAAVLGAVLAVAAAVPTVVTAQVSVGHGHDWATDLSIVLTVVATGWFGLTWALAHHIPARHTPDRTADRMLRRYHHVAGPAWVVVVGTRLAIGHFELAGESFTASAYGIVLIVLVVALAGLGVSWVVRAVRLRGAGHVGLTTGALRWVRVDLLLVLVVLALQVALVHIPPPRFLQPQSGQINYLGFEVPEAPQLATMLLPGRPNVLLAVVAVLAVGCYLWGVVRLRRRGDTWPVGRTVAWLLGWSVVLVVATTRVWMYSSVMFSWHMLIHMTLNMLVPVLLALAGPITLLLRAAKGAGRDGLGGPRDAVESLLAWPLVQRLTHPLVIWAVFVGSFYALYFSPLFGSAMKFHWAHQFMTFHFLVIGVLFYGLVVGVDRPARPLPHIARLGFVFAAMPFHAFFAVGVLSGDAVIGENFYHSLDLAWLVDLAADQQVGGQIAWATGELPLLIVIIALIAQWFRQDQRAARRLDRAYDAGHDDSEDAYNDMLAELAKRDQQRSLRQ